MDDKSIMAWGNPSNGGKKVPVAIDLGYTKIYSNEYAFAVLKTNGLITTWGIWYGWCSYLRNSHQYYHPLHSQQQE
jgi:hypothetical protein